MLCWKYQFLRGEILFILNKETRASKTYCTSGSSDAILALINAGANVTSEDKDGLNGLYLLMHFGINVSFADHAINYAVYYSPFTGLHCAGSRGHVECMETLICLCGAEVDIIDNNGCTPLFYSVTLGHADCTELLLQYGSDPNRQDRKGRAWVSFYVLNAGSQAVISNPWNQVC